MTPHKRSNAPQTLAMAGLLVILAAAALPLLHCPRLWLGVTYAAGAALLLCGRLMGLPGRDEPMRVRRLGRMEIWTALVFTAAAVFLFLPVKPGQGAGNDWLAFTLAGAMLTVYTSLMMPRERRRALLEGQQPRDGRKSKKN